MSRRPDKPDKPISLTRRPWLRAVIFVCSVLFLGYIFYKRKAEGNLSNPIDPRLTQQVPYGVDVTYKDLSATGCRQTERLRVCSHQANAHELKVDNGSLAAYRALWDAGIRCFDIDFVSTKDMYLVASHPSRLQSTVGSGLGDLKKTVQMFTIIMLRSLGADDDRFPVTPVLLEEFAKIVNSTEPKNWMVDGKPDFRSIPMIYCDLKGRAFHKDHIWNLGKEAEKYGIKDHIALYSLTPSQDYMLKHEGVWSGPLIRGYMDFEINANGSRVATHPQLTSDDLSIYHMLGPSIKLDRDFYEQAQQIGKPVFPWVIDTPQELFYSLEMQVDSVVSNVPVRLSALMERWKLGCRMRFPRQQQQSAAPKATS